MIYPTSHFRGAVSLHFPADVAEVVTEAAAGFGETLSADDMAWAFVSALSVEGTTVAPEAPLVGAEITAKGQRRWLSADELKKDWTLCRDVSGTFIEAVAQPIIAGAMENRPCGLPVYSLVSAVLIGGTATGKAQFYYPELGMEVVQHYGPLAPEPAFSRAVFIESDVLYRVGQSLAQTPSPPGRLVRAPRDTVLNLRVRDAAASLVLDEPRVQLFHHRRHVKDRG